MTKTPDSTRKKGKSSTGGLNAKGKASYNKANPESNFKASQPKGDARKKSLSTKSAGQMKKLPKAAKNPNRKANFGNILSKVAGSGALGLAGVVGNKIFGKKKAEPAAPTSAPASMKKGGVLKKTRMHKMMDGCKMKAKK